MRAARARRGERGDRGQRRDVAADQICGCTSSICAEAYGERLEQLTEKYQVVTRDALLDADGADDASRAAYHRAGACVAARTMPVASYVKVLGDSTEALCACQTEDCSRAAIGALDEVAATYYWIDGHDDAIAGLDARYCACLLDAMKRGFDVQITKSITVHVTVDAECG